MDTSQLPSDGLKRLNRVVEKNINQKYVRHNVLWFIWRNEPFIVL